MAAIDKLLEMKLQPSLASQVCLHPRGWFVYYVNNVVDQSNSDTDYNAVLIQLVTKT